MSHSQMIRPTQVETLEKCDSNKSPRNQSKQDQQVRLVQKMAELQHEDDMASMRIEEIEGQNAKLTKMIADKKALMSLEK